MKVFTAFVLLSIGVCLVEAHHNAAELFTKIECSSSGKTCKNPYCFVNLEAHINNSVNFGCEMQREVDRVYFRDRIYDIDEETDVDEEDSLASDKTVNYCIAHDVHEDEKQKFLELSFSGLIRPCPLSAINVVNGSRLKNFDMRVTGKYKTITTIFDDLDDKIFEVVYYEEFQSYD